MGHYRPTAEQAKHLVQRKTKHGISRQLAAQQASPVITSIGTERKYTGNVKRFLDWLYEKKINRDRLTSEDAANFLYENSRLWKQSTIDGYRQAIELVFDISVKHVHSAMPTVLIPRAYTRDQISYLSEYATPDLRLSIQLASDAGLRAHELLTLSRPNELAEDSRPWLAERFSGREQVTQYIVVGKGGLRRAVMLSNWLAAELEQRRFNSPVITCDRTIYYSTNYNVLGGQTFSQMFGDLSTAKLTWSTGAHGLRHHFAKARLQTIQRSGFLYESALRILSQELGHFSVANTLKYLR